jgi:hypothetical protein
MVLNNSIRKLHFPQGKPRRRICLDADVKRKGKELTDSRGRNAASLQRYNRGRRQHCNARTPRGRCYKRWLRSRPGYSAERSPNPRCLLPPRAPRVNAEDDAMNPQWVSEGWETCFLRGGEGRSCPQWPDPILSSNALLADLPTDKEGLDSRR